MTATAYLIFFVVNRPRILVIQSENETSYRSREFKDSWKQQSGIDHLIAKTSWFSLDHDTSSDVNAKTVGALRYIDREAPDIVVLMDDEANDRLARHLTHRDRIKLVFVAIDQTPEYYGYHDSTKTLGVREHIQINAMVELLSLLHAEKNIRYGVIGIDNPTGRARLDQIRSFPWKKNAIDDAILVSDFHAWKSFILNHQDLDVLFILNFDGMNYSPSKPEIMPINELISWTEENSHPLPISVENKYVRYGGGLAFEASPRRFAEIAVSQTRKLLDPGNTDLQIDQNVSEFEVALCISSLKARGITVPTIYLESARLAGTLYP